MGQVGHVKQAQQLFAAQDPCAVIILADGKVWSLRVLEFLPRCFILRSQLFIVAFAIKHRRLVKQVGGQLHQLLDPLAAFGTRPGSFQHLADPSSLQRQFAAVSRALDRSLPTPG